MNRTEEDAPKRRERPRRDSWILTSFPNSIGKEADLAMGRGRWGQKLPCEWTPLPLSWVVLSTILSVLAEKQKLKLELMFNFQVLDFRRKQKNLAMP